MVIPATWSLFRMLPCLWSWLSQKTDTNKKFIGGRWMIKILLPIKKIDALPATLPIARFCTFFETRRSPLGSTYYLNDPLTSPHLNLKSFVFIWIKLDDNRCHEISGPVYFLKETRPIWTWTFRQVWWYVDLTTVLNTMLIISLNTSVNWYEHIPPSPHSLNVYYVNALSVFYITNC